MKYKNNKGFSLIEVMISVAIIASSVVSIMFLFSQNVKNESQSRNKLIATYLAQEQMEIIRQQRDNAWYGGGGDWLANILEGIVIVSVKNTNDIRKGYEILAPGDNTNKILYCKIAGSDCVDRFYVQSNINLSGSHKDTGFKRWATITKDISGDFIDVISYVSDRHGVTTSIETRFYKWQWR